MTSSSRFASLLTTIRNNQKLDQDAIEYLMDVMDNKRRIAEDLEDYKKSLTDITERYKKTHAPAARRNEV
jgi:Mg2+ and Co2+ transporter CorA